jgi:hypothetical protein
MSCLPRAATTSTTATSFDLLRSSRPSPSSTAERCRADRPLQPSPGAAFVVTTYAQAHCRPPSGCPLPPLRLINAGSPSTASATMDNPGEPPSDPSFTSNQSTATLSCSSHWPPPTSPLAWSETVEPSPLSSHGCLPCFTVGSQPRDQWERAS